VNYLQSLRGSGRTTRMIKEAIKEAKAKKKVCIVSIDDRNCRLLMSVLREHDGEKLGIQFASLDEDFNVSFDPLTAECCFRGVRFDKVFIDHYAIEYKYQKLLSELHRFDKDEAE